MMITLRQRRGMPLRTQGSSWYTDWCSKYNRYPGAVMTVYQGTSLTPGLTATGYALFRAGIKVSAGTCEDLAASLRRRHERNGTRWRLLSPLAQAARAERADRLRPGRGAAVCSRPAARRDRGRHRGAEGGDRRDARLGDRRSR